MNTNTIYINQSADNTSFTLVVSNDETPLTKESIASTLLEVSQHFTQGDSNEGRQQLNLLGILPKPMSKFTGLGDIEPVQQRSDSTNAKLDTAIGTGSFTEWYSKGNGAV